MIEVATLDDARVEAFGLVADHRALAARGLFVAEGRLVVARLIECSARPGHPFAGALQAVLLSQAAWHEMGDLFRSRPEVPCYVVPQPVMNGIVGFNIHRGCLALASRPAPLPLDPGRLSSASRVIVLDGVNNPDNIGGVFRSAAALGADLVVLGPACGDPLYRKAIRTSMGAVFTLPFAHVPDLAAALGRLRETGFTLIALSTSPRAVPVTELVEEIDRVALLAGAEGDGLSAAALAAADRHVRIPMTPLVDSLNVTVAVSIALYSLPRPPT